MEIPTGLELKESAIHGLGIFAIRNFPDNHNLGEFVGTYMKHKEFKELYGNDRRYCYIKKRTWEYRVAKEKRNFITYMNDGAYGRETPIVNVVLRNWCSYTTRPIMNGEELLLDYGRGYPW
jgi:SET domain-containing protein